MQPVIYKFDGLGTTHFTVTNEATGEVDSIKQRIHSFLLKMDQGRVCLYWKEFMRDDIWQPTQGPGWPVFKPDVKVDLANLKPMPTFPIANFKEVEIRVQVNHSN